jgi:hypothetical protein
MMRRFVDYLERTSTDLVPLAGLGDWYDYGHGRPAGASQFTAPELTAMATFARCAAIVEQAEPLGDAEGSGSAAVNSNSGLTQRIAAAFTRRWFDGTNEFRNQGSPQTANSMALVTGLVREPVLRSNLLERVVADIRARGNQQTAGDIGYWYLLRALAEGGRSDVIFDLVSRTNLGSYGFIVNNGWTAMPEAWDANTGASMNHCMLGHIQEWFLGWVAGIRAEPARSPDGEALLIEPWPVGDLTWARGEYESLHGRIVSEWRIEKGRFALNLTLPANTRAVVRLPVGPAEQVTEGGRLVEEVRGVRRLGAALYGRQEFLVAGGGYRFEVVGTGGGDRAR